VGGDVASLQKAMQVMKEEVLEEIRKTELRVQKRAMRARRSKERERRMAETKVRTRLMKEERRLKRMEEAVVRERRQKEKEERRKRKRRKRRRIKKRAGACLQFKELVLRKSSCHDRRNEEEKLPSQGLAQSVTKKTKDY
jgi:hypothetical protein